MYNSDKIRKGALPLWQYWYRKTNRRPNIVNRIIYRAIKFLWHIEIPYSTRIGKGLYVGHPFCITINPNATIGDNCNIHKGVTIGQENRGKRKGTPTIGNCVWIGINSTIVGGGEYWRRCTYRT